MRKNRQLKTDILFATMLLLTVSVSIIVWTTYHANTNAALRQSSQYILSAADSYVQKITDTLVKSQDLVKVFAPQFENFDANLDEEKPNHPIFLSLSEYVNNDQNIASVYYADLEGRFFQTLRGKLIDKKTKLGKEVEYVTKYIFQDPAHNTERPKSPTHHNEKTQKGTEILHLYSQNRSLLDTEKNEAFFDPRKRPWFQSVEKSSGIEWSDIYVFLATVKGEAGITVSGPVNDPNGNLKGVFAVDITLKMLSTILSDKIPSPHSLVYILSEKDEIVGSSNHVKNVTVEDKNYKLLKINDLEEGLMKTAYNSYQAGNHKDESRFFFSGEEYSTVILNFPSNFAKKWRIVIVFPLSDFIGHIKNAQKESLIISLMIFVTAAVLMYLLARRISNPIKSLCKKAVEIKNLEFGKTKLIPSNIEEVQELSNAMNRMEGSIESFSKYVPKKIVQELLDQDEVIRIGGHEQEVTIMFTDVADFTSISENKNPQEILSDLSEHFEEMSDVIMGNRGVIDKFIGDSVMALWGAPTKNEQQAIDACLSALFIIKRINKLNHKWQSQGKAPFNIRIGINCGVAVVGNMGSEERMNYTALGDSVNLASRLEGINKFYNTQIIISESVYDRLDGTFVTRPIDFVGVKGKEKPIKIYELIGITSGQQDLCVPKRYQEFCMDFEHAFNKYTAQKFEDALKEFKEIKQNNDTFYRYDDSVCDVYIDRIEKHLANPNDKFSTTTVYKEK